MTKYVCDCGEVMHRATTHAIRIECCGCDGSAVREDQRKHSSQRIEKTKKPKAKPIVINDVMASKEADGMAVHCINIECKLCDLADTLANVEKEESFNKWISPPMEQLDRVIGSMTKPGEDQIPKTKIYYLVNTKVIFKSTKE